MSEAGQEEMTPERIAILVRKQFGMSAESTAEGGWRVFTINGVLLTEHVDTPALLAVWKLR